jgi:hypothetical protein
MKNYVIVDANNFPLAICKTPDEAADLVGKWSIEKASEQTSVRDRLLAVVIVDDRRE